MGFVFSSAAEALAVVGQELGTSDWIAIEQDRIDEFARATGDFQWIHVDPERAKTGPFGKTVAHGYLTFSLINMVLPQIIEARDLKMGLNYGAEKLRFPAPVPVGSRLRYHGLMAEAKAIGEAGVQCTVRVTAELEGSDKPACVADITARYYF